MNKTKLALLGALLLMTSLSLKAQSNVSGFYLGTGTGINSGVGAIGLRLEYKFEQPHYVGVGLGIGTWGGKAQIVYGYELNRRIVPFIGIGKAAGLENAPYPIFDKNNKQTGECNLDLSSLAYVPIGFQIQWFTKTETRLFLELGYAAAIASPEIKLKEVTKPGFTKDDYDFTIDQLKGLAPGGLIIGFGVCFKLSN